MDYRIEKKEAFRIMGLKIPLDKEIDKNFQSVPVFWQEVSQSGAIQKLCTLMTGEPNGILGVSACMGEEAWEYYISVVSDLPVPDDFSG